MTGSYKDPRDRALRDANERLSRHVIKEEPVRSFRFHMHYVDKKHDKGLTIHRPGFRTYAPSEGAKFQYNSTYAYTLTWTPGHMTIVGDIGELTVVHYHAMPTLEEACEWLLSPDYHYLLSKTKERQKFDSEKTIEDIWRCFTSEVEDAKKYYAEELARWEAEKPKWLKRDGMTKAEFEAELKYWNEDHPKHSYGFSEKQRPHYSINRNLWSDEDELGWRVPEGYMWLAKLWKFLYDHDEIFERDPNFMLTAEGLEDLKYRFESWASGRAEDEILGFMYRDINYDDYSGVYEYRDHAFFQIAAIQHGCRMILDRHFPKLEQAA